MPYPDEIEVLTTDSANADVAQDLHPQLHDDANRILNTLQELIGIGPPFDLSAMVEDWHVVGDPGEPDFIVGKENEDGSGADVPAWGSAPGPVGEPAQTYSQDGAVRFCKDPLGWVHLAGVAVVLGAFDAGVRIGRIFQLPAGYRPDQPVITTANFAVGDLGSEEYVDTLVVLPSGDVGTYRYLVPEEPEGPREGYIGRGKPLDNISFRAAA